MYVSSSTALDWTAIAAQLRALGAWTISAACDTDGASAGSYITDNGELLIDRLEGAQFDRYFCNAPLARRGSDAARAAAAIYRYLETLARQVGPPPPS